MSAGWGASSADCWCDGAGNDSAEQRLQAILKQIGLRLPLERPLIAGEIRALSVNPARVDCYHGPPK